MQLSLAADPRGKLSPQFTCDHCNALIGDGEGVCLYPRPNGGRVVLAHTACTDAYDRRYYGWIALRWTVGLLAKSLKLSGKRAA